ncbi:gephyrin-like molybdotransferase Glp [Maricaulis sp.]|uniref:molybdopterin molybdotransferase MoeA n=1 Tax=Maricaulis sp. TaxID=1486257 RepID=UPI0026186BF6|nr:gephyrin-like molybdotransferase Glp [Maricaulis sp.]
MIGLDEAHARLLGRLQPVGEEEVDHEHALMRRLSRSVAAARTQPPVDVSAMDGYAVQSASLGEAPVDLLLAGESAAGHAYPEKIKPGECIRVSTGAAIPAGADQVVIQENTARKGQQVTMQDQANPGRHIRRAGLDFARGDTLLPAGAPLTAEALALAVSAGVSRFQVWKRPLVGILSTGDELVEPGQSPAPDQIYNSISHALAGMVQAWGGQPHYVGIARDNPDDVAAKLDHAQTCDLLVTVGGASVGDHDHLRRVFAERGGQLVFEKIAVKPGKPTWFGMMEPGFVLGLPGNPVSALVMARLLLRPALAKLSGADHVRVYRTAALAQALAGNGDRETFVRARLDTGRMTIAPDTNQDSSALSALVRSNALIRRKIGAPAAQAGERVEFIDLD